MDNPIYLFEGTAPGSENITIEEVVGNNDESEGSQNRFVSGIVRPSMIPFLPEKPNGMAVLVIPGGSYRRLMIDSGGVDIALWLNSFGVVAFVLKHRMPNDGHKNGLDVPLQDAQRAVRLIRGNAGKYGVDPGKIGVIGFSSGGHLAASVGTCFDVKVYEPMDEIDRISARPDFIVPVYAGTSTRVWQQEAQKYPPRMPLNPELFARYSTDERATSDTPPAFILVADDDATTPSEHSVSFYLALRRAGVPAELHVFKKGGHGFAIRKAVGPLASWTNLCREWMLELFASK